MILKSKRLIGCRGRLHECRNIFRSPARYDSQQWQFLSGDRSHIRAATNKKPQPVSAAVVSRLVRERPGLELQTTQQLIQLVGGNFQILCAAHSGGG